MWFELNEGYSRKKGNASILLSILRPCCWASKINLGLERRARAVSKPFVLVFLSGQEEQTGKGEVARLSYQPMEGRSSLHSVLTSATGAIRADRTHAFVVDLS